MVMEFTGDQISDVLLSTGWVRVRDFRVRSVSAGGIKWPTSATFETEAGYTTIPASSVLGVRGVRPKSAEEVAAERADAQAKADATLSWQTYAPDRETFNRLYEAQEGKCKGCGIGLSDVRFRHYVVTVDGPALLCHHGFKGCSPLLPRYGEG